MRTEQPKVQGAAADLWWAVLALAAIGAGYCTLQLGAVMGTGEWLDVQAALRGSFTWTGTTPWPRSSSAWSPSPWSSPGCW